MIQAMDVGELVSAAARGEQRAWNDLVARYMPLVRSVVRGLRLSEGDAEDVSQTVWLRLVEHLDSIREPRALPGWIATTTRNEALGVLASKRRSEPVDPATSWLLDLRQDAPAVDSGLLRAEWQQALRDGLAELEASQMRFLLLLVTDPPLPYEEIGRIMNMPIGSIGPTRMRCLKKLRATASLQRFFGASPVPVQRQGGTS